MLSIKHDRADSADAAGSEIEVLSPTDPTSRFVQVALALYLTPVVAVVCAIGGLFIAFDKLSGAGRRLAGRAPSDSRFRLDSPEMSELRMTPVRRRERRRARVAR